MNKLNSPEPVTANLFHAGNTCPHCQEPVSAGQLIVTCPKCSSIHHETCWGHKSGCSSYHCDTAVRTESANLSAEIVINSDELKNVVLPPPRPKRNAAEVAAQFLPKKPNRLSRMAIASCVLAGVSLTGVAGAFAHSPAVLTFGIFIALIALTLGVLAMLAINNTDNRIHGLSYASIGVIFPVALIIVYFGFLGSNLHHHAVQMQTDLKIGENLPAEEQLARMTPAAGNAMRANVVIRCASGFETRYGSGIVLRVENRKAYIMTNKHVIGDNKTSGINVVFYTGEESDAKVEWSAPGTVDIAIISCQVLALDKYNKIKISDTLLGPGEKVFAVGNPMGLSWTYTEGTISSLRKSKSGEHNVDLYQTQTPINSGNSGGGLYTAAGELVGVNTMTEDKSVAENLNFAIALPGILKMMDAADRDRIFGKEGK